MQSNDRTWERSKSRLQIGETVSCVVTDHCPFGVLVRLDQEPVCGVIERIRMNADGFHTPEDYPPIGANIMAELLGFRDYSRQVELRMPPAGNDALHDNGNETLIEVGLRIQTNGELTYFGVDEVNQAVEQGQRIVRMEEGRAIMVKSRETQESVKLRLQGFSVLVVIGEP